MAELVKSTVKCYKKKTKKTVGGERKTYEYNQYQIPLKKSDNLACSEEVFIIPQDQFDAVIELELEHHKQDLRQHKGAISEFQKDLADLEWKHGELSRSYKALVSKNAKTNKLLKQEAEKSELFETLNTTLKQENIKLLKQLERIKNEYNSQKETENGVDLKKDQNILKSIRSRFSSREVKDPEDE
jgi:chromosome segregation ATPase